MIYQRSRPIERKKSKTVQTTNPPVAIAMTPRAAVAKSMPLRYVLKR